MQNSATARNATVLTIAGRFREKPAPTRRHGEATATLRRASIKTHPRIDEDVGHIDDEIDHDDRRGDQYDRSHRERVVAIERSFDEIAPYAWDPKSGFDVVR